MTMGCYRVIMCHGGHENMAKRRKKPGPKPKPPEQKRSKTMCVKMTTAERAYLKAEAERLHVSDSEFLMQPHREAMAKKGGK